MRDLLHQLRWALLVTIAGMFGAFVIQNATAVELQVFVWTITTRRAFLVLASIVLGFGLGWVFGRAPRRR